MSDIVIASGKGGTGKTTLSTNLAALLAETEPVVLVDLDVEEPNSGLFIRGTEASREIQYKYIPQWDSSACTLCGLCQRVCNFHAIVKLGKEIMIFPQLCHGCFACSDLCPAGALPMVPVRMGETRRFDLDKLMFIESRLDIGEEQAVPLIAKTKRSVKENFSSYHYRIYDAPPGTSCPVIETVRSSDLVILVTEPSPFGLNDLQLAVETIRQMGNPFGVVINRYGVGNDSVDRYCETEGIPVLARLPNDQRAAELYTRSQLIYRELPRFRSELEKVANYIKNLIGSTT